MPELGPYGSMRGEVRENLPYRDFETKNHRVKSKACESRKSVSGETPEMGRQDGHPRQLKSLHRKTSCAPEIASTIASTNEIEDADKYLIPSVAPSSVPARVTAA